MIQKRNSFVNRNVVQADEFALRKAIRLESELSRLALSLSIQPERSQPWREVKEVFTHLAIAGYKPSDKDFMCFVNAAKVTYRMESSLIVEQAVDKEMFVKNPLTLRIKFYIKEDRKEFLEWKMVFSDMAFVHRGGMTGHGELGTKVMPD